MDDQSSNECESAHKAAKMPWYNLEVSTVAWPLIRRFRFSLKSLLVLVSGLVFLASAYRLGNHQGFKQGLERGYYKGRDENLQNWQLTLENMQRDHRRQVESFLRMRLIDPEPMTAEGENLNAEHDATDAESIDGR